MSRNAWVETLEETVENLKESIDAMLVAIQSGDTELWELARVNVSARLEMLYDNAPTKTKRV